MSNNLTPIITQPWELNNRKFITDVFDSNNFEGLEPLKQVYVILVREDNKIAIVKNKGGFNILPGGGVEEGENALDTLVRETKEETNCDVDPIKATPLFFQKASEILNDGTKNVRGYELRYIIPIKEFHEFKEDPDNGDIVEVYWIDVEEISIYLEWWGDSAIFIQNKVQEYLATRA